MKSGLVRFAVDTSGMQTQTDEIVRQSQSGMYKKSKSKKIGQMEGADFRIEGTITSIVKRADDVKDVYYKFSLQLIDNESGVMEWADEKEIRKTSNKSMF
jgi:PBP1b-binding outer membrane lipoprotein LpoB